MPTLRPRGCSLQTQRALHHADTCAQYPQAQTITIFKIMRLFDDERDGLGARHHDHLGPTRFLVTGIAPFENDCSSR